MTKRTLEPRRYAGSRGAKSKQHMTKSILRPQTAAWCRMSLVEIPSDPSDQSATFSRHLLPFLQLARNLHATLTDKPKTCPSCKGSNTPRVATGRPLGCQKWDSNPRLQKRLRPERSALDRSAILTHPSKQMKPSRARP